MEQTVTADAVYEWLNTWAPFASAEEWDNVGLLVGDADRPVTRVLTALDVTPEVIAQAVWMGAELIVSHHPVLFRPVSRLRGGDLPFRLIQNGIAAIGAHTNLDKAAGGVNDLLAERLELEQVVPSEDGLCRIGRLRAPMEPAVFAAFVRERLSIPEGGIRWSGGSRPVSSVGVCGGAGGDYLSAILGRVDAFVTGELHYHEWPRDAAATVIAAGHYHTEILAARALAERLADAFPTLTVRAAEEQCPCRFL